MYGNFIKGTAGYEIKTLNLPTSWEYIYENKDILFKVDQFGPVYSQANPPGDIVLFKREQHQKYSPWFFRIEADRFEGSFTNFFRPNTYQVNQEPENLSIQFLPECAKYYFEYQGLAVETEFMIPKRGITVVCKFKIKNIGEEKTKLKIGSQFVPYFSEALMAPWHKYEWFLDSSYDEEKNIFCTRLLNDSIGKGKRHLLLQTEKKDALSHELSLEKYLGAGDITNPEMVYYNDNRMYGCQPVYALLYGWELSAGEEKEITQILTMDETADERYLDQQYYMDKKSERKREFEAIFNRNRIKTSNSMFDYYANYWIPMQMRWVSVLDRGWPTGMRGTRDSAQDYTGLLYTSPEKCREVLTTIFECQRTDGWFPRQYSAKGKHGNHDLRNYVDGGNWVIEFLWKYLAHTRDFDFLKKELEWLDKEEPDTVLEHTLKAAAYYMEPENIGEHGLCKIREGDWFDGVSRAGLEGRGESVTVAAQTVMSMKYLTDILMKIIHCENTAEYLKFADKLKENMNRYAFNSHGFYNSIFNDDGVWVFSDNDPDGEERIYSVANYYAVISGVAGPEKYGDILKVADKLKGPVGYNLFNTCFGNKPIDKVGRLADGLFPPHLTANVTVYNHGSQGFLARALSVMGEGDKLFDVFEWMTPYDMEKHPTKDAFAPPYAITNCYQLLPGFVGRAQLCFLSGSVAMATRGVYEFIFGVKPQLDGLVIDPCLPKKLDDVTYDFEYLNAKHTVRILNGTQVYFDGKPLTEKRKDFITSKEGFFVHI